MEYYIVNLDYSNKGDAVFWREGGMGYTRDLTQAGMFPAEYCRNLRNDRLVFIPVTDLTMDDTIPVVQLDTVLTRNVSLLRNGE